MIAVEKIEKKREKRSRTRAKIHLTVTRPSILDPCLETEPWIDHCCCSDKLCLFLHNRPIAIMAGTSLDCVALNTRLNQLRHRMPRQ